MGDLTKLVTSLADDWMAGTPQPRGQPTDTHGRFSNDVFGTDPDLPSSRPAIH
jgi:hypothetical protein